MMAEPISEEEFESVEELIGKIGDLILQYPTNQRYFALCNVAALILASGMAEGRKDDVDKEVHYHGKIIGTLIRQHKPMFDDIEKIKQFGQFTGVEH